MGQHRIFEIEQAICPGDSHCDRRERLRYRVHVAAIVSHPPEGDRSLAVTRDVDAFQSESALGDRLTQPEQADLDAVDGWHRHAEMLWDEHSTAATGRSPHQESGLSMRTTRTPAALAAR